MDASIVESQVISTGTGATRVLTFATTPTAGDVVVVAYSGGTGSAQTFTSVSGMGGSWTTYSAYSTTTGSLIFAVGTGVNASGTVTVSVSNSADNAHVAGHLVRGTDGTVTTTTPAFVSGTSLNGPSASLDSGQAAFATSFIQNGGTRSFPTASSLPSSGAWTASAGGAAVRNAAYAIPTGADTYRASSASTSSGVIRVGMLVLGSPPSAITGTAAGTLPALVGNASGSGTVVGIGAATLPPLAGTGSGTVTTTGAAAGVLPALTGAGSGTVDDAVVGIGAGTLPSLVGDSAGTVTTTGAAAGTLPALVGSGTGDVDTGPPTGAAAGTLPSLTGSGFGLVGNEDLTTLFDEVVLEDLLFVELAADADLDVAVPILSEKRPSPELTALLPAHQAWVDYTPTTEVVGFAHIWVDDVDITYFRGKPTLVRNWTKEAPWGDKTAMWEMPQLDPWDVPGSGDLSFIRKGARVVIGIVDDDTGEITRKWSGFYHARRKGFDSAEDYVYEAHGTMWAAMGQAIEPVPYQPPVDIGVLIPRLLNGLIGRPFNVIPETLTGITTRYRGARDERVWQAVQNILAREGWTNDGRQWTLAQVAEDEFRLVLKKAMTEIDGTVAWGNPGVDFDIVIDEDSRVDAVFCRWVNPGGGESANVFYPGLELLNGLPYPNSDAGVTIGLGDTDAGTDSGTGVTDLQERLRADRWTSLAVTGTVSAAWVAVFEDVQEALDLTVDGIVGPQSWTAFFTTVDETIDLNPRRLPLAFKSEAWPTKDGANGQILGPNPDFDGLPPNFAYLDQGTNITKAEVRKNARTYLAVHGTAVVTGTMRMRGCLDDLARTDIDVGDNIEVRGFEGSDVVVQVGRLSVDLDASEGAYVVTVDIDERARDALTIDQILQRNRDALPDPARRPGSPNRTSRNVRDEGFSWDADSPCGKLTRTAINGNVGIWSRKVVPFAEVGQLAGIRLHSTVPFAMMLFESLRITENMALDIVGDPTASSDPYRPVMAQLMEFGYLGAWGAQGDMCGYSYGTEGDGYPFTGLFTDLTTLEFRSETSVYVSVLFYATESGFVWGDDDEDGFLQARQT